MCSIMDVRLRINTFLYIYITIKMFQHIMHAITVMD